MVRLPLSLYLYHPCRPAGLGNRRLTKGVRGLYDGLTGTLLRQMTYSMMRFAAYDWAKTVVHTGKFLFNSAWVCAKKDRAARRREMRGRVADEQTRQPLSQDTKWH
jgi:hypothetical protein